MVASPPLAALMTAVPTSVPVTPNREARAAPVTAAIVPAASRVPLIEILVVGCWSVCGVFALISPMGVVGAVVPLCQPIGCRVFSESWPIVTDDTVTWTIGRRGRRWESATGKSCATPPDRAAAAEDHGCDTGWRGTPPGACRCRALRT